MTLAEQILKYMDEEVERLERDRNPLEDLNSPYYTTLELRNEVKRIVSDYMKQQEQPDISEGGC